MESMSMTHQRVVPHNKRLPQLRYSPYTRRTNITNNKQKQEAIRLGVELSLFVAEAMFLLSDDIRSMLFFCVCPLRWTWKKDDTEPTQVVSRMICVMLYVFETYIKSKNGVYKEAGKSNQSELVTKSKMSMKFAVRELDRFLLVFINGGLVQPSEFEHLTQEIKKIEETLRSSKDVLEANGFARDVIKSNILLLWKSPLPNKIIIRTRFREMTMPLMNELRAESCSLCLASLQI